MAKTHFFHIAKLVERLQRVASANRFDQVARNIHALYEKTLENDPNRIVSAKDLKNTFSTFASMNRESNFRDYFDDVFISEAPTAAKQDGAGSFDMNRTFGNEDRVLASTINTDPTGEVAIKSSSLTRVKNVVSSVSSTSEYKYAGFVRVANLGNSGFANWSISINTGKGTANIKVPVSVVDGFTYIPDKFFTASGQAMPLTKEALLSYVKSYSGAERPVAYAKSGLTQLGPSAMLVESQMTSQYDNDARENDSISLNYTIPINEKTSETISITKEKIQEAIDAARQEIESKIAAGGEAQDSLSISLSINYAGSLPTECEEDPGMGGPEDAGGNSPVIQGEGMILSPRDEAPVAQIVEIAPAAFNGIVAFNIKSKSITGSKVATVPVEVTKGRAFASSFVGVDGKSYPLTYASLNDYLDKEVKQEEEQDEFSDAFLASDGSLADLKNAMREGIEDGNLERANFCLNAIASRFDSSAIKIATSEYFVCIKTAKQKHAAVTASTPEQNSLEIHLM